MLHILSFVKFIAMSASYTLTVFGTDTHTNGADGGFKGFNYYDNGLNSGVSILQEQWTFLYQGINQANAMIESYCLTCRIWLTT